MMETNLLFSWTCGKDKLRILKYGFKTLVIFCSDFKLLKYNIDRKVKVFFVYM